MLYQVHLVWAGFECKTLIVTGTDCIGSYKSNYYTITTTTAIRQLSYNFYTNFEFIMTHGVPIHSTDLKVNTKLQGIK